MHQQNSRPRATAIVLAEGIPPERALAVLEATEEVEDVLVFGTADRTGKVVEVLEVLAGGATRRDTTVRAIEALTRRHPGAGPLDRKIIIIDAGQRFDARLVRDCFAALRGFDAVDATTVQGVRLSTLRRAYETAAGDPRFRAPDACAVVRSYLLDVPVHTIAGLPDVPVEEQADLHAALPV